MIYRFAKDLGENLSRRGYPVTVSYAGAVVRDGAGSLSIDVQRDLGTGELIQARLGIDKASPRTPAMRQIPVLLAIDACAEVPGARSNEHEAALDQLVDAVIVEVLAWAWLARTQVSWGPGVIEPSKASVGLVYQMRFTLARAVGERSYSGTARSVAAVSDAVTTVDLDPED